MRILKAILSFLGVYLAIALVMLVAVFAPCYLVIAWLGATSALLAIYIILMFFILGAMLLSCLIFW